MARRLSVGTGGLGNPPPGVAVVPLLPVPAALRTLAAGPSPGTGRESRGGGLAAWAAPARGLAFRTQLVALGGLAVAAVCSALLRGGATPLGPALSPLLLVFARLPRAAALLAARRGRGGSRAAHTGAGHLGDHELASFIRVAIRLYLVFGREARQGSPVLALARAPFLAVLAALLLVPILSVPRVPNFVGFLGFLAGVLVALVLTGVHLSVKVVPVVVRRVLQPVTTPSLGRPGGRGVREGVRVRADIVILHERLHCAGTRRRRVALGKILGLRGLPINFCFVPFSFRGRRGHRVLQRHLRVLARLVSRRGMA